MKWMDRFMEPGQAYRPKLRYWVPNGMMSETGIRRDLKEIARRGFGSVEVVSMTRGVPDRFFTRETLWGGVQWLEMMNVLLREAREIGLKVDIGNGPVWPIVDVNAMCADCETTLYELGYGLVRLKSGQFYHGAAPAPKIQRREGTPKLVALSLYRLADEGVLDFASYLPLPVTEQVSFQVPQEGEEWVLFSFWGRPSAQKNSMFYVVDHFSEKGTNAIINFWEKTIFPALKDNLDVCESIFCDSLEYRVDLEWTRTFPEDFERRKGYSILPYLPVLGNEIERTDRWGNKKTRTECTYPTMAFAAYQFTDKALQHQVNADFFEMLTHLFCENHVKPLEEMARRHGLQVRYQVSYGKTLETECAALYPGIPENEGLGGPLFDRYRNMSGAVHLGRKPVYSFECAAEAFHSYGQTHEDILWWMKRAYVCGINAQVLHGGHYCGYYDKEGAEDGLCPGTTWPGFEGFTRRTWSNAWNRTVCAPHQKAVWDYMARCNFLLRGRQKVDVAIYRNDYLNNAWGMEDGAFVYRDNGVLNDSGYTYEFLSPALLEHPNAVVTDGVLDRKGAGYKALILNCEETLSYQAAKRMAALGKAGLPILIAGRMPGQAKYRSDHVSDEALQEMIRKIGGKWVPDLQEVPAALQELGIVPDLLPERRVPLKPVHIQGEGCDFYYIYNSSCCRFGMEETLYPTLDKKAVMHRFSVPVSLSGTGAVYEIDGFTGKCTSLACRKEGERTAVSLYFREDEAKIIGVMPPEKAHELGIQASRNEEAHVGTVLLGQWQLTIQEIYPPVNRKGTFYESQWRQRQPLLLKQLLPWNEISPELDRVCGIGVYETAFSLQAVPDRAVLCLEQVCDTYDVEVNGVKLPFTDPAVKETALTGALQKGTNRIKISVASTLQNQASIDFLMEEGKKDKTQAYGMWGAVKIELYQKI